jgi:acetyl-CoA carboxylase biotin carboxylase subunit
VVDSMEEMPGLLQAARREAEASFGDGNVYLEKLIHNARHIEFQVLADSFGNVIHLGERECSLQRRHQKLLEESPSPFLDPQMRQRMGQVACRAAQAVDYVNAGTIEFLVDKEHEFYFLEMNTRLQVEHPVTEVATGVDIVREQIHIAQGGALRFKQEDVAFRQWALECRINAEDPFNHFLPSTGRITQIALPAGPGVRIDTGVYRGMEVSPYYDSLIAKLICWGETRQDAILRMRQALDEYHILGITTNIPFHQRIMQARRFVNGDFDTRFVEERFSMQEREGQMDELREVAAIMATLVAHRQSQRATRLVRQPGGHVSKWKWAGRGEQSKA